MCLCVFVRACLQHMIIFVCLLYILICVLLMNMLNYLFAQFFYAAYRLADAARADPAVQRAEVIPGKIFCTPHVRMHTHKKLCMLTFKCL